ncbi:hypothetical protein R3P38DRAFT_3287306 [Favolaschia claudopus]|uniref:Uncharacterized protein n=1 Tax=Favolaschia claudopus TaxID=2862362 RepID=A0AAW0A1L3_9AGAR
MYIDQSLSPLRPAHPAPLHPSTPPLLTSSAGSRPTPTSTVNLALAAPPSTLVFPLSAPLPSFTPSSLQTPLSLHHCSPSFLPHFLSNPPSDPHTNANVYSESYVVLLIFSRCSFSPHVTRPVPLHPTPCLPSRPPTFTTPFTLSSLAPALPPRLPLVPPPIFFSPCHLIQMCLDLSTVQTSFVSLRRDGHFSPFHFYPTHHIEHHDRHVPSTTPPPLLLHSTRHSAATLPRNYTFHSTSAAPMQSSQHGISDVPPTCALFSLTFAYSNEPVLAAARFPPARTPAALSVLPSPFLARGFRRVSRTVWHLQHSPSPPSYYCRLFGPAASALSAFHGSAHGWFVQAPPALKILFRQ